MRFHSSRSFFSKALVWELSQAGVSLSTGTCPLTHEGVLKSNTQGRITQGVTVASCRSISGMLSQGHGPWLFLSLYWEYWECLLKGFILFFSSCQVLPVQSVRLGFSSSIHLLPHSFQVSSPPVI